MRSLLVVLIAALAFTLAASPAVAKKKPSSHAGVTGSGYTLDYAGTVDGVASFTVTRATPTTDVEWVLTQCYDAAGARLYEFDQGSAVVWGTWDSLAGTATVGVGGDHCESWLMINGADITDKVAYAP